MVGKRSVALTPSFYIIFYYSEYSNRNNNLVCINCNIVINKTYLINNFLDLSLSYLPS